MTSSNSDESLLDVEQVGRLLNLRPATIRNWLTAGKLPRVRLSGRAVRVPKAAVDRLIASCSEPNWRR